jgi:hypothetical protein
MIIGNSASQYEDKCGFPLGTSEVPLANYTTYPMQAIGMLFGHDPKQNYEYACSASLIGNPPNQILSTAGHCVGQNGYFNTNLMFFPGWHDHPSANPPSGGLVVSGMKAFSCWIEQALWDCDYAFARVESPQSPIRGLSIGFNVVGAGTFMACGYPADGQFDGSKLECTRNAASRITKGSKSIASKMTEGASGGPWIVGSDWNNMESKFTNIVNGVTSHKSAKFSDDLWSPKFDDDTLQLCKSALPNAQQLTQ